MVVVRMVLDRGDDDNEKKKSCGFMVCSTAGLHDWVCSAGFLCNDFRIDSDRVFGRATTSITACIHIENPSFSSR